MYGSLTMNMPAITTKLLTLATISMSLQVRRALLFGLYPPCDGGPGPGEGLEGVLCMGNGGWTPLSSRYHSLREGPVTACLEKAPGLMGRGVGWGAGADPHAQSKPLLAHVALWYKLGKRALCRIPEDIRLGM